MSKEKLAENMRILRRMYGYSVATLANKVGRAPNTMLSWEKGKVSPDVDIVEDLCRIYEISPDEMFGWRPCKKIEKFLEEKEHILKEMDKIQKERTELDQRLKEYTKMLSALNKTTD